MKATERPTLLFVRDFRRLTGGHLKFSHYLGHIRDSGMVTPLLYQTPGSRGRAENPFDSSGVTALDEIVPADLYFVGGLDWTRLDAAGIDTAGRPVVNLIQHVRHADPADPRFAFLARRALRICCSPEVEQALRATGRVNGDIVTIPYGIDLLEAAEPVAQTGAVFIAGWKNPALAATLADRLRSRFPVDLAAGQVARDDFVARMAAAAVCVLLPSPTEGFFLPAIEAMALGVPVVVPDCVGNRAFCRDGVTCLMPDDTVDGLAAAAARLMADASLRDRLRAGGRAMAGRYAMDAERRQVQGILAQVVAG